MATNTYQALLTQTLSTAAASVTFSSIPQGYTDLVLVANMRGSGASFNNMTYPLIQFNGDTGTNYSYTSLFARNTGSSDTAVSERATNVNGIKTLANTSVVFSPNIIHIQNYSNTTTFKTVLNRGAGANGTTAVDGTLANVGLWRNTTAITSVTLTLSGTGLNFVVGSNFSLYGIAAEGAAYATGGMVTSDSTYYYHTFLASGAFVPKKALTCDYLVVAGGGGGGTTRGGGGGAGAYLTGSAFNVTATNYTITVGAGGAGAPASSTADASTSGITGNNSIFASVTATGGGYGGLAQGVGGAGGSGGGAGGTDSGSYAGGAGTTGGNNGGAAYTGLSAGRGGGGGGASAVGAAGTLSTAGAGGNGLSSSISGSSVTYAGGGGGGQDYRTPATTGAGGTGGGGAGGSGDIFASTLNGTSGTANTGGGGGGGNLRVSPVQSGAGGAGGSGIVIIRYPK